MAFHLYLSIFHLWIDKGTTLGKTWPATDPSFCGPKQKQNQWRPFAFGGHMGFSLKLYPFE